MPATLPHLPQDRQQIRPLGIFSDYVCESLPRLFHHDEKTAASELGAITDMLRDICPNGIIPHPTGLLDVKMLHNACTVFRRRCLEKGDIATDATLKEIQKPLADVIHATMTAGNKTVVYHTTYDDIILNNPPEDMRAYTAGVIGESERTFYHGHQVIEEKMEAAASALRRIRDESLSAAQKSALLQAARTSCTDFVSIMRAYITALDKSHFAAFKGFFDTDPFTGEKGPSGAFTAKIPMIDAILYGAHLPADISRYVDDNRKYFPARDLAQLDADRASPLSLMDQVTKGRFSGNDTAVIAEIAGLIRSFRQAHLGAVHRHIGQAAQGSAEGNNADAFLRARIGCFTDLHQKIKKEGEKNGPHCPFGFS